MSPRGRAVGFVAAAAVALGLLSGCGQAEANRYAAEPAPAPPSPVLDSVQVGRVLKAVDAAVVAGWAARDTEAFGARAEGPFRSVAAHDLLLARKLKKKKGVAVPPPDRSLTVVPVTDGWPRFFLAVGTREGHEVPVVQVFRSGSARDPYALWGELDLLPGRTWPQISADPTQAVALDPSARSGAADLTMSPQGAVDAYARLLTRGFSGKAARAFDNDAFARQVRARVAAEKKALAAVAKVTSVHTAAEDDVLALRLGDGSALVIGRLTQKHVIAVKKGSGTVTLTNPDIVALIGTKTIKKSLTRRAVEVVALRVPAPGSGKVSVIAAGKGDVKVSGS